MFWLIYLQEDWLFAVFAGDDIIPHLYGLPLDMFDCLLTYLPPAALQKLQDNLLVKQYASFLHVFLYAWVHGHRLVFYSVVANMIFGACPTNLVLWSSWWNFFVLFSVISFVIYKSRFKLNWLIWIICLTFKCIWEIIVRKWINKLCKNR